MNTHKDKGEKMYYKPTYKLVGVDYQNMVGNDGVQVETVLFYKRDEHMIGNPPSMLKRYEKIKKLLVGTGISKITITFLDNNL